MKFSLSTSAIAAVAMTVGPNQAFGVMYTGTIKVENLAPVNGTCLTPVWAGIHDGVFDTYNRDEATSEAFEPLVEDGNNAPLIADFAATAGTVWDGTVGMAPICYAESATLEFEIDVTPGAVHYFSYASMVLPSNDAFVSNGNPQAFTIFDVDGNFVPVDIEITGEMVLDAGTEVNDELPENTAFFGQMSPDTGVDENGVVITHPGFNAVGSGGILDDPQFANADFTADDYMVMRVTVEVQKVPEVSGVIKVTNKAPANGTCITPVWAGIHAGTFDTYNRDEAASDVFEPLVEDGNNAPLTEDFANTDGTVWDATIGMAPLCPGESAMVDFSFALVPDTIHYFSYASMILPSNDAFVSNGNPTAFPVFDADGTFTPTTLDITGEMVLDAGTEVNDELPENTAFFGQMTPDTGVDENGVVVTHPGFNAVGSGGILDDPRFVNADFKADDYMVMQIEVTLDGDATPAPGATPSPAPGPTDAPSGGTHHFSGKIIAVLSCIALGSFVL